MEERSMVAECEWRCLTHRRGGAAGRTETAGSVEAPFGLGADPSTRMTSATSAAVEATMRGTAATREALVAAAAGVAGLTPDLDPAPMIADHLVPDPLGLDPNPQDLAPTLDPRRRVMESKTSTLISHNTNSCSQLSIYSFNLTQSHQHRLSAI